MDYHSIITEKQDRCRIKNASPAENPAAPGIILTDAWRASLHFKLHCLNRDCFNMAMLKYTNFQGFLITGQHSGTHWIKWMLSHAIAHRYGVAPPRYVNNNSSNDLIGHPKHPRIHANLPRLASMHSIAPYALQWNWLRRALKIPPIAVVVRDVRNVLVSNYEKWQAQYGVPFSTYLAGDPQRHRYVCDVWWYMRFQNRWAEIARRYPDETLILHYENFRTDPLQNLRRLSQHFQLDLTDENLTAGLKVGTKETMLQHQDPSITEKPIRLDGQGKTLFSPQDHATLSAILRRHLRHDLGYHYFPEPRGFQGAPIRQT